MEIPHAWPETASPGEALVATAARVAGDAMIRDVADQLAAAYSIEVKTAVLFGDPAVTLISAAGAADASPDRGRFAGARCHRADGSW